jgi:DNA damage-binding protein 1
MAPKEYTLYLAERGLGFSISGGTDAPNEDGTTAVLVSRVDEKGAARLAGLKVGDRILSVNGTPFSDVSHADAVDIIKTAIPTMRITMMIERAKDLNEVVVNETPLDRIAVAREAYKTKDEELSRLAHDLGSMEQHQTEAGQYVKAAVFGGLDGIITTFAVVASVAGANLPTGVVILMGFANLVADGISMGVGEYLSGLSELQYTISERNREEWEFECNPEAEKKEMIELYKQKGFSEDEAETIMNIMCQRKDFFIDHMMVQELGLMPPDVEESPAKNGGVMFVAFLIFGLIPLFSYLAFSTVDFGSEQRKEDGLFGIACGMTATALFVLGAIKSKFSTQTWWASGFSVLFNGGLAACAAYLIGFGLEHLVDLSNCPDMSTTTTMMPLTTTP